jgi:hypothetical protein
LISAAYLHNGVTKKKPAVVVEVEDPTEDDDDLDPEDEDEVVENDDCDE